MVPLGKPKPGCEDRFNQIFRILQEKEKQPEPGFFDRLKGKRAKTKDELLNEWFSIQIPSYVTIKAPMVGRDPEADAWAIEQYGKTDKKISQAEFIAKLNGYYVIELSPEPDAVPMYISMNCDRNVFRGQFMNDCVELIGESLVNEAWESKLAPEALDYGVRLMKTADRIAAEHFLEHIKNQRKPPEDHDSIEAKLHVVYSLAKWLIYYGKNGHGYEADY